MAETRDSHDYPNYHVNPAKPKQREPQLKNNKNTEKNEQYTLIQELARQHFKHSIKFIDVKPRERRREYLYKIKVVGFDNLLEVAKFQENLKPKIERFKFYFSGSINVKTGRQELFIYITLFTSKPEVRNERSKQNQTEADASVGGFCKEKRVTGVFGKTEIKVH